METFQHKAQLLESREHESSTQMNVLTTENVLLKTKIAVCILQLSVVSV